MRRKTFIIGQLFWSCFWDSFPSKTAAIIGTIVEGPLGAFALLAFIQTLVTPGLFFVASGFSAAVDIIFDVAAAIRASALDPIEALLYE